MDIELLSKYLTGECSKAEKLSVDRWLSESVKNQDYLNSLNELWELSSKNYPPNTLFNTEVDWAVLKNRMDDEGIIENIKTTASRSKFSLNSTWSVVIRVAAIFLLAGLFGLYTFKSIYVPVKEVQSTALKEISMSKGKRGGVTLSDGTKVYLNADSRISIPPVFSEDSREVYLEGEAYFDVAKNPNKPFIINTNGAIIQVLGTSFVVKNYSDDKTVQTVVESGVVSFRRSNSKANDGVILTKGKLARLDLSNSRMITENVDNIDFYLSWKRGELKFDYTAMSEVAKQLERRYDITVVFDSDSIKNMHLTAELRSKSMDNVIRTIATSLGLKYKISKDKVTFNK